MTPPLDSRQSARCGRSSMFLEQGDRSHPTLAVWQGGTHSSGAARVGGGEGQVPQCQCCGHSDQESRLGEHLESPRGGGAGGSGMR